MDPKECEKILAASWQGSAVPFGALDSETSSEWEKSLTKISSPLLPMLNLFQHLKAISARRFLALENLCSEKNDSDLF